MVTLDDSGFGDDVSFNCIDTSLEVKRYTFRKRKQNSEDDSEYVKQLSKTIHKSTPQRQSTRKRVKTAETPPEEVKSPGRPTKAKSTESERKLLEKVERSLGHKKQLTRKTVETPPVANKKAGRPMKTKHVEEEEKLAEEETEQEDIKDGAKINHSHDNLKRQPCKACSNCLRPDCRNCIFCKDKKKYGGPNIKKQKCQLKEKCSSPTVLCQICKGDVSHLVGSDSPKSKTVKKSTKPDKTHSVEIHPDTPAECGFCHRGHQDDPLEGGKMFSINGVSCHYFCMLFSYEGRQLGADKDGLFGYYGEEVKKQMDVGEDISCQHCAKPGATARCSLDQCGASMHFPFGMEAGATFQFMGRMDVFCKDHRLRQDVESFPSPPDSDCVICYEEVKDHGDEDILGIRAPCCGRHLHRDCVQRFAMTSGTKHFKCPNCNNKDKIAKDFKKHGIYIPHKDAEWELPEQSSFYNFQDMHLRERRCSISSCLCEEEEGRRFSEVEGEYEIVLCGLCGTNGAHIKCGNISQDSLEYVCEDCGKS